MNGVFMSSPTIRPYRVWVKVTMSQERTTLSSSSCAAFCTICGSPRRREDSVHICLPSLFINNPIAAVAAASKTLTDAYSASIRPPTGSKQALCVAVGSLMFKALSNNTHPAASPLTAVPFSLSDLPWSSEPFLTTTSYPHHI